MFLNTAQFANIFHPVSDHGHGFSSCTPIYSWPFLDTLQQKENLSWVVDNPTDTKRLKD